MTTTDTTTDTDWSLTPDVLDDGYTIVGIIRRPAGVPPMLIAYAIQDAYGWAICQRRHGVIETVTRVSTPQAWPARLAVQGHIRQLTEGWLARATGVAA